MHSTKINGSTFTHNGGFDGEVQVWNGKEQIEIPFDDLKGFVAEYVRQEISRKLEGLGDDQVLLRGMK